MNQETMYNYITFADSNYMSLALTLYDSLVKQSQHDFKLHFLVNTQTDYDIIKELPHIVPYLFDECKKENSCFTHLESTFKKAHDDFSPFHFMTTPIFIYHVLSRQNVDSALYVDADLYFYDNPEKIFDTIGSKSVGLCAHKSVQYVPNILNSGYYNVGSLYFKNNDLGRQCLDWWVSVCLDSNNPFFRTHGNCGDQKYLEIFEKIIGIENICLIDYEIGHIAPWNITMMTLTDDGYMDWDDRDNYVLKDRKSIVQKIVYMHFSHFKAFPAKNEWKEQRCGEWGKLLQHPGVAKIYAEYFLEVKNAYYKYGLDKYGY